MLTESHLHSAGTVSRRARIARLTVVLTCVFCSGCVLENGQNDSVFGPGRSQLACDSAIVHSFPDIAGTYGPRHEGGGSVSYYGDYPESYGGSPEIIWIVQISSAGTYGLYLTFDPDDDLDLIILKSCDVRDTVARLNRRTGSSDQANVRLESGTYFMVADGFAGKFHGQGAVLQITRVSLTGH